MTLEQLRTLCAIVESGSFRAAAEVLHKSQSSLSYSIRQLEEEFNIQVFSREQYRPELTAAGRSMYERARGLLQEVNEFESLGHHLGLGVEPEVSLAISALTPMEPIIPVLREFARRFPHTRLKMSVEIFGAIDRVRSGVANIAVTEGRDLDPSQFEVEAFLPIHLVTVAAPTHPLAKVKSVLHQTHLMNYPHLILRSTGGNPKDSAGIMEGALTWSLPDFQTKLVLLRGGLGWGHMPFHLVKDELAAHRLVRLKVPEFKGIHEDQWLLRRTGVVVGKAHQYLWQELGNIRRKQRSRRPPS
ncbi:MAG: LysR family transcriptional regulator [Bdellovibrionales bacterium]|nr:LysR family transcriptional regulator [Bdellovibrionales bacterium]